MIRQISQISIDCLCRVQFFRGDVQLDHPPLHKMKEQESRVYR
ncbi:hypothetical protein [Melghiribacillus thermohalophilus]|nr:hypothetical protein [Melghiribacillus thermohalophilus]